MPKFVIEREIPGAGAMTRDELHAASVLSCGVLDELGPDIQWVHSHVTQDRIYCIYIAQSEQLIREHAERSGFPANRIAEVRAMIDPTMGSAAVSPGRPVPGAGQAQTQRGWAPRGLASVVILLSALLAACGPQAEPVEPARTASFAVAGDLRNGSPDAAQLSALRQVTARFHELGTAMAAGYATRITPCWAHHSAGAMGYHYARTDLLDAEVDLLNPEVLMYEPQPGGHMRLVGMEYIVPIDAWEQAGHDLDDLADVPELLGQKYTRHSTLPIFKLHVWLWRQNPSGAFADWNPKVTCAHAEETEVF